MTERENYGMDYGFGIFFSLSHSHTHCHFVGNGIFKINDYEHNYAHFGKLVALIVVSVIHD